MLGKIFALILALSSLLVTVGLVTLQVSDKIRVEDIPFAKHIKCLIGLDEICLEGELAMLRDTRSQIKDDIEQLNAEVQAFQGADVVQVSSGDLGGWYVYVVAVFDDPDRRRGLKAARCHAARDIAGPDHDLPIAKWISNRIEPEYIDAELSRRLDLSPDDIARGRAACPWPSAS